MLCCAVLSVGQGLDLSLAPWSRQAPSPHLDGEGSGDQGPREQKKTKLLGGEVVQGVEGEAVGRLGGHVAWQSQGWQGTKCNTAASNADSRQRQQLAQHQSQKQKYLFW